MTMLGERRDKDQGNDNAPEETPPAIEEDEFPF